MRRMILAIGVTALLLLGSVGGCGGGGNDSSTAGGGGVATNEEAETGPSEGEGGAGQAEGEKGSNQAEGGKGANAPEEGAGGNSAQPEAGNGADAEGGGASGGGGPPAEAPASSSKTRFVAKANALCKKRKQQIKADVNTIFGSAQGKGSQSQQAALQELVNSAIAPGLEGEADELRKLDAPPGDEGKVDALVAGIEAIAAEARKDPSAFLSNAAAFDETQKMAREYGIGVCGTLS